MPNAKPALEHYFFAQKFNKLVHQSLKEFADQYNTGAVNAKKVKAIKKAWKICRKRTGRFKHMETKDKGAPPNDKLQASLAAVE